MKRRFAVKVDGKFVQDNRSRVLKFASSESAGFRGYDLCGDWRRVTVIQDNRIVAQWQDKHDNAKD